MEDTEQYEKLEHLKTLLMKILDNENIDPLLQVLCSVLNCKDEEKKTIINKFKQFNDKNKKSAKSIFHVFNKWTTVLLLTGRVCKLVERWGGN